jgi:hypothetical protein
VSVIQANPSTITVVDPACGCESSAGRSKALSQDGAYQVDRRIRLRPANASA